MESLSEARDKIWSEVVSDGSDVRTKFLEHFGPQVEDFSDALARAVLAWRDLDSMVCGNEKRAYVSALVFTALTLQIQSMKLFLSGQLVAAGNMFRQVIESIALALVCSGRDHNILNRFIEDKYSTNDAVRDVVRNSEKLGLLKEGIKELSNAQSFYHMYSHPTKLTLAATVPFSVEGIYVGASFDDGKIEAYTKEINGRVGLAGVVISFVDAVKANIEKWGAAPAHESGE